MKIDLKHPATIATTITLVLIGMCCSIVFTPYPYAGWILLGYIVLFIWGMTYVVLKE